MPINANQVDWEEPLYYKASRMDKMDPDFVASFLPMAREYYDLTGEPLRVTDTYRTYDEQADLYDRKPHLAARPGHSNHERGMAMDLDQSQVPAVEKYGLLEKYGFHRPVLSKGETWHIELNPTSGMVAGPGATEGRRQKSKEKETAIDKAMPIDAKQVKWDDAEEIKTNPTNQIDPSKVQWETSESPQASAETPPDKLPQTAGEKPTGGILDSLKRNLISPENQEFDPHAEPSKRAGELIQKGIDKTQEAVFYPLHKALEIAHKNIVEPVRQKDITSQAGGEIPEPGRAAPEAFAPLAEEKTFVPTMETFLAGPYLRLLGKAGSLLGEVGKDAFYKYAPDWMFRKGEAGLPEVLPAERIAEILGGMSGEERAAAARKYPAFRDVLQEWQMGGKVPETSIAAPSAETTGSLAISRPKVSGELAEPQLKLPEGQGFELKDKVIRRPAPPTEYSEDYLAVSEKSKPPTEVFREGKRVEGQPLAIPELKKSAEPYRKAVEDGNLAYLVKLHGGIDADSYLIKKDLAPEERKRIAPYLRKGAIGPDKLLQELQESYPGLTAGIEDDADFVHKLVNGELNGKNPGMRQAEQEYLEEQKKQSDENKRIARIDRNKEELARGQGHNLTEKEIDTFWDGLESTDIYSGIPVTEIYRKLSKSIKGISEDTKPLLFPGAKSPDHFDASVTLGTKLGQMHRRAETSAAKFKTFKRAFEKEGVGRTDIEMTQNPGMQFASDMSQGKPQTGWKGQAAKKIGQEFDDRLRLLDEAGAPLENVRENYFPGMWSRESVKAFSQAVNDFIQQHGPLPNDDIFLLGNRDREWIRNRVNDLIQRGEGTDRSALAYLSRRPFKGKESFRKEKVFDDIMDAVSFGLKPVDPNPITLAELKLAEMDRSIMANQAIKEWKEAGKVKFSPVTKSVPEGWVKINDKYGTVYAPPNEGEYGRRIVGHYIATEPVADILNNYLSQSLYNNPYGIGKAYRAYMGIGNALNQFQLGVGSFFHGGFTSVETQITKGAEVLKDIYGVAKGNRSIGDLGRTLKSYPAAMVQTARDGNRIIKEWTDPSIDLPIDQPVSSLPQDQQHKIAMIAKAVELAGGGFKIEKGLMTEQSDKMVRDWYSGREIHAALRSPIATVELMAKPLMSWFVPRQKAGVFGEMAGRIIEMNPGKSLKELAPDFRQAWNRVDSRLGQVRYDRLFMHNAAKNVIQGIMRAPGWTGGTIAEVGGAPVDAAKFFKEWSKTGKAPENIPDRVAYVASLVLTTALANGLLTMAFTGERPHGMDWFAFRDGGKDKNGNPSRLLLPSYMKDILAWRKAPGHTALSKTHPLINLITDIYKGYDYYGNMFRNPDDNLAQQVYDTGKYSLKAFTPFWIRGTQRMKETEGLSAKSALPLVGIMPAPKAVTNTKDLDILDDYTSKYQKIKTKEEAAKIKTKSDIYRIGEQSGTQELINELRKAKDNGLINDREMKQILMNHQNKVTPDIQKFKRAPIDVMLRAYQAAPPDRQEKYKPILGAKINNKVKRGESDELTPHLETIQKIFGTLPEEKPKKRKTGYTVIAP